MFVHKLLKHRWQKAPIAALNALIDAEEGQSLAEYTMIIFFAVIVCVAAVTTLGQIAASSPAWTLATAI